MLLVLCRVKKWRTPCCSLTWLGGEHGFGSLGFRWSYVDNLGVLARGENCADVHLARLNAGVQKVGLDVHDISFASGNAVEVSPANVYCSGTNKRISRTRSVSRTVSSRRRISGRAMELVSGHESFLALSKRGALSILDASFQICASVPLDFRRAMVNCAFGTESFRDNSLSLPKHL